MKKYHCITVYILIFLFTFFFVMFCSPSTSPLNPFFYGDDSAYFQTDGRVWASGHVPYRDLFDHKGPVLLLVNMLAYLTPCPRYALCLFQTLFIGIFFCAAYRYLRAEAGEGEKQRPMVWSLMLVCVLHIAITIGEGNNTELYCIAPCFIPLWNELKWLRSGKHEHDPGLAFSDGLGLGVIFLINAKNAFPLCLMILMLSFLLIIRRKLKDLLLNIIAGMAGMLLAFLPFCIFFLAENALYDMLYATFIFNIRYLTVKGLYKKELYKLIIFSLPEILLFLGSIKGIVLNKKREGRVDRFNICIILLVVLTESYLISGMAFKHYFLTGVVFIPVYMLVIKEKPYLLPLVFIALMCVTAFVQTIPWYREIYSADRQDENQLRYKKMEEMLSQIPRGKRDQVYVYQVSNKELYVVTDLKPLQRFPYFTELYEDIDPKIKNDVHSVLEMSSPEYVLVGWVGDDYIKKEIEERYKLLYEDSLPRTDSGVTYNDHLSLYELKK